MVLFVLVLNLGFAPLAGADDTLYERDYVAYVYWVDVPTVLTGEVVDSETRMLIHGAEVFGQVHSEYFEFSVRADEKGRFRVVLPSDLEAGEHAFVLKGSAIGYDNRIVSGEIFKGDTKHVRIELNYNPFDVQLAENSGSLERGWVENRYYLAVVDNYKATRQVITGYRGEAYYGLWGSQIYYPKLYASEVPASASYKATFWDGFLTKYYDTIYGSVNNPLRREVGPNPFQDFTRGSSTWYLVNSGGTYNGKPLYIWDSYIGGRSYIETAKGFRQFQGFSPGSWGSLPVYEGTWHIPKYYVSAPTSYYYVTTFLADAKITPLYGTEEYTVWRTTTYDVRDSVLDKWASKQTTVTAIPLNGYKGSAKLALEFDDGIEAVLDNSELRLASPASTTLTLTPKPDTSGSLHLVAIRAYDLNGRMVVGGSSKPAPTYSLDLTTLPKPPVENTVVSVTESETKPSEVGQVVYVPSPKKEIGAFGGLYDKATGSTIVQYGNNVVSTISSNYRGSFTKSGMLHTCSPYYDHCSWTSYSDEVWVMDPMKASATGYNPQTRSTTVYAGGTTAVNFSLTKKPY